MAILRLQKRVLCFCLSLKRQLSPFLGLLSPSVKNRFLLLLQYEILQSRHVGLFHKHKINHFRQINSTLLLAKHCECIPIVSPFLIEIFRFAGRSGRRTIVSGALIWRRRRNFWPLGTFSTLTWAVSVHHAFIYVYYVATTATYVLVLPPRFFFVFVVRGQL